MRTPVDIEPFALVCGEATASDAEELHPDMVQSAQERVAMVTKTTSDNMVGICWRKEKMERREEIPVSDSRCTWCKVGVPRAGDREFGMISLRCRGRGRARTVWQNTQTNGRDRQEEAQPLSRSVDVLQDGLRPGSGQPVVEQQQGPT